MQIGNQDTSRVASRFKPELVDAFNMLILLLPGIAITYMVSSKPIFDSHLNIALFVLSKTMFLRNSFYYEPKIKGKDKRAN